MMSPTSIPKVRLIPIDQVEVVNPRLRNMKQFREIVANIGDLGLKRPITVTRRPRADGPCYDLVCGQGRLEAYRLLGQSDIPALVVEASGDDCLIMSLVENCARRKHGAIDLLHDIQGLKSRGYREAEIAKKTGLSGEYVRGVIRLFEKSEHRLLRAVESGHLPVSVAVEIAESDDAGVQRALQEAYEKKELRGRRLIVAKRIIEQRRRRGKGKTAATKSGTTLSSESLVRAYRQDADRKRLLIRKAESTRDCLIFITEALKNLRADENFVTLLRAEKLDTLPRNLAARFES